MNWEDVFTVHVKIKKSTVLHREDGDSVVMIAFAGDVAGRLFQGKVLDGGIDTQIIGKPGGHHTLSARYMLEGTDCTGETCLIYIENNGEMHPEPGEALFRTHPKIITNSQALSFLNHDLLVGEGLPTESGVDISLYRWA